MSGLNPWRGLYGLPREVWVISAVTLANRMGTMVLPFLILYLTQHLGYGAREAGFALTVFGVGGLVSAPVAGRLCDRVGALRVMQASLFLSGSLLILFPLARSLPAVMTLTLLWAVVGEAVRPASLAALTGTVAPEKRKAAIALNRLAINLGMSVGPAVGGFLAMVSFPILFVVDGATSVVAALALTALLLRPAARPLSAPADPDAGEPLPGPRAGAPTGVLRDPAMLVFLVAVLLVGLVFLQHEAAMSLYVVRDLGNPKAFYGMLFLVNTLLIVVLEVPLNLAMASWTHRRAMILGALLIAAGFGALAFAREPLAIALTVVVWTFGEMIFFPVSATYVADAAPAGRRGEYLGAYSMTWGLGFTIGPWAGTMLLDGYGPRVVWGAAFLCGAVAAAVFATMAREPAAAYASADTRAARAASASPPAPSYQRRNSSAPASE